MNIFFDLISRTCVYRNENTGNQYWEKMHDVEPRPRFAHQLVYDNVNKVFSGGSQRLKRSTIYIYLYIPFRINKINHIKSILLTICFSLFFFLFLQIHYLFGGNPGRSILKTRLDDFWMLKVYTQNNIFILLLPFISVLGNS